jgi:hypothetical protein
MVTSHHEASHRIFQERPELLSPVFDLLGLPLPEQAVIEVLTPDVTEIRPLERRVDSVLRISGAGGDSFLLAIEAQMRPDYDKAVSWAYYLSYLKAKYDCSALLLVVCQDKRTADWAAGPFPLGLDDWPALTVHPLVVGPGNIPVVLDTDEASANLAMAAFSAMTHGRSREAPAILDGLAVALGRAGEATFDYYAEMLEIGLGETHAREVWRGLMTKRSFFPGRGTLVEEMLLKGEAQGLEKGLEQGLEQGLEKGRAEGLQDGLQEGLQQGRAEGFRQGQLAERARSVAEVLKGRGFPTSFDTAERLLKCTDLDTLDRWYARAWTVERVEDVFGD